MNEARRRCVCRMEQKGTEQNEQRYKRTEQKNILNQLPINRIEKKSKQEK